MLFPTRANALHQMPLFRIQAKEMTQPFHFPRGNMAQMLNQLRGKEMVDHSSEFDLGQNLDLFSSHHELSGKYCAFEK